MRCGCAYLDFELSVGQVGVGRVPVSNAPSPGVEHSLYQQKVGDGVTNRLSENKIFFSFFVII